MASGWAKNETVAAKRRCDLVVVSEAGTPAPPGTNLMGLGIVFISGVTQPDYTLAVGTATNKRKPIGTGAGAIADDTVEAVDHATNDTLQLTAHLFETGDGPVRFTTSGTLPAGLSLATDYWLIKFDANNVRVATSLANAYANSFINLTSAGTGTHTLDVTTSTFRGIWGEFTYEATQAETNHDGKETVVIVDGTGFRRMLFCGAFTTVMMQESAAIAFNQVSENGRTYGDQLRVIYRTLAAKFSKTGNDYVFRDDADTKDSHSGTVTTSGRTARTIIDPT